MKLLITLITILLFGITSCTDKSNLVDPNSNFENPTLSKQIISKTDISITQRIRNNKGGTIKLRANLDPESGQESAAYLTIPKNSMPEDIMDITVSFVPGFPDIELGPHGTEFSEPLTLDLKIENSWFDKNDKIDFKYVDVNGNPIEDVEYEALVFRFNNKYVKVKKAQLSHFSRYAFTR